MNNPYWGCDFWEFLGVLLMRFCSLVQGKGMPLVSDEVQILVLITISISCSVVGTFLVVRKMAMLANSLSHTILVGIVIACLFFSPKEHALSLSSLLFAAVITAFITVGMTRLVGQAKHIKEAASIGLSFTTLFALGLIALMLFTKNAHIGTEVIMGNLDAAHPDDLWLTSGIALGNILIIALIYPVLKVVAFDKAFASSVHLPCRSIDILFLLLLAATSVAAFRAVGVLLVLAFLTGPILTIRLYCHRLPKIIFLSCVLGGIVAIVSVAIARHLLSVYRVPLSTAGIAVTLIGLIFSLVAFARLCRFDFRRNEC